MVGDQEIVITKESAKNTVANGSKDEIMSVVTSIVTFQNTALSTNRNQEAAEWNDIAEQLVNRFTNLAREECFNMCIGTEDPMYTAVNELTFGSIRIVEKKDKTTEITTREVKEVEKDIDLLALKEHADKAGVTMGADPKWVAYMQKMNYLLAIRVGQSLGDPKWADSNLRNISSGFQMCAIARELELYKLNKTERANPLSNGSLLKELTVVVKAMLGDKYSPINHDVAFLRETYARKDRGARKVQLPAHRTFALLMRDICNNCITKQGYVAESKCVKKDK